MFLPMKTAHSLNGRTFDKNDVAKITSDNPREHMVRLFGIKWAFEYDEPPDMSHFPKGITDLSDA